MANTATATAPTYEQLKAMLAAKEAELEAAKAKHSTTLRIKASEKGAVSVYGLGRFPTTLYAGQWQRLNSSIADVMQFIEDNKADLAWK